MTLKYEKLAQIGDRIRAYDFQPVDGRKDSFLEGIVEAKGRLDGLPYDAYRVKVTRDVFAGEEETQRVGEIFYVPFETTFDYNGRVLLIDEDDNQVVKMKTPLIPFHLIGTAYQTPTAKTTERLVFETLSDAVTEARHWLADEATVEVQITNGLGKVIHHWKGDSYTSNALSPAERQRRYRARMADKDRKEVRGIYATDEQAKEIKAFAKQLIG